MLAEGVSAWPASVTAAMIDNMDRNIGRVLDKLRETGRLDNTLVLFLSDNGASGENAEPTVTNNSGPIGSIGYWASFDHNWANVSGTPFRYDKNSSYSGGTCTPLIAWWPGGIEGAGRVTHWRGHLIDIMPTLLEIYYRDTAFGYLADVARLEWACAEADTAADSLPLDLLSLAHISEDDCTRLRFTLRAPVRLLSSRFPIFSIWEAHQADDVEHVPLSRGPEHVLVTPRRGAVRVYRLDAATFALARSLADGESLADAATAAEQAGRFSLDEALKTLAQLDVLAGFRLPADEVE